MGDTLSNLWGGITTGAGNAWDWLTGPSAAQQAMQAGRWNDPSLAWADRATALGQAAQNIVKVGQAGGGGGAVLGALGEALGSAGIQPSLQRSQIGEALARAGLLQQQTAESQAMLPLRQQLMGAQTGLVGVQTTEIQQMLGPRIAELASQTGLNQAQAASLYAKTPAEVRQILAATGLDEARIQSVLIDIAKSRSYFTVAGLPDPLKGLPTPGASLWGGTGDYNTDLATSESGGNYTQPPNAGGYAGKYQFGAPLLSDLGVYKMGDNEQWAGGGSPRIKSTGQWTGQFDINGFPDVHTLNDFLKSPGAQDRVQQLNVAHSNNLIDNNGLDKFIGQTVAGVPVTREGMLAAIHLAGPGGLINWLQSGGRTDVADVNGTRVSDYMRRFAGTSSGTRPSPATAPTTSPTAAANDVTARDAAASDASRRAVGDLSPAQQALLGPRTAAAVPPPIRSTGNPNLDALLAGGRLAQTGPRGVGAPGSTFAGPGAPTGTANLTPAQQALLAPLSVASPGLFGPRPPPVNFGTPATAPATQPAPAPAGPTTPPPAVPRTMADLGPRAAFPPGMTQAGAGDTRISGTPAYGLESTDTPAQALAKIKAQDPSLYMRLLPSVLNGDFSGLAMYMHPPVTILHRGTGDPNDPYHADPGEQMVISYDPMKPTDPPTIKTLKPGVDPDFLIKTANEASKDFRESVDAPNFNLAASQVQSAFRAYARETDAGTPGKPAGDFMSDATILHAWAKIMDPRAIVRAGTMDFITRDENAQQAVDRWVAEHTTGGRLSDRDRDLVMRNIEDNFGPRVDMHNSTLKEFQDRAVAETNSSQAADLVGKPYTGPTTYSAFDDARQKAQPVGAPVAGNPLQDPTRNPALGEKSPPAVSSPATAAPAKGMPPPAYPQSQDPTFGAGALLYNKMHPFFNPTAAPPGSDNPYLNHNSTWYEQNANAARRMDATRQQQYQEAWGAARRAEGG